MKSNVINYSFSIRVFQNIIFYVCSIPMCLFFCFLFPAPGSFCCVFLLYLYSAPFVFFRSSSNHEFLVLIGKYFFVGKPDAVIILYVVVLKCPLSSVFSLRHATQIIFLRQSAISRTFCATQYFLNTRAPCHIPRGRRTRSRRVIFVLLARNWHIPRL